MSLIAVASCCNQILLEVEMFSPDQVYVVFGASSGIGKACALSLIANGATIVGIGRNAERLETAVTESNQPERFHIEVKDVAEDVDGLAAYVKELRIKYGKLSGLVYSAGVSELTPIRMWSYENAKKFFDINYFAPISILKGFSDKRNVKAGNVSCVLLASAAALLSDKGHCTYSGSKAALIASAKSIAKEVVGNGIRVNCISPSNILTPMLGDRNGEYVKSQQILYPLGLGHVEDVSCLVEFLLSDKAKWITGQNYVVDCASF